MRIKLTFVLIAVFAVTAAAQTGKDNTAIQSVIKKLVTAQTDYDPKTLDSIFTSDYVEISPVGEFDPRDKVLGYYKPDLKPDPTKMTAAVDVTDYSIREYGNFAIAIARFNYAMTAEGKPLPPRSMRATFVLRKEKGEWKIASAHYTGIRPPAPPKPN